MAINLDWANKDCRQCSHYTDIKELVRDAEVYYVTMYCAKLCMTKAANNACCHHTQRRN